MKEGFARPANGADAEDKKVWPGPTSRRTGRGTAREDVAEHVEVVLVLVARRELEQVEIRPGDAHVFGLAAVVRPHVRVARFQRIGLPPVTG